MIEELNGRKYGRQKIVAKIIASRLNVSWRTVIFYGFRSEEYRKRKHKLSYLYKKRHADRILPKQKEYSRRHHERKKLLQGKDLYWYQTRFAESTRRRFSQKQTKEKIEKAIVLAREHGIGFIRKYYKKNSRFLCKVLEADPTLAYYK